MASIYDQAFTDVQMRSFARNKVRAAFVVRGVLFSYKNIFRNGLSSAFQSLHTITRPLVYITAVLCIAIVGIKTLTLTKTNLSQYKENRQSEQQLLMESDPDVLDAELTDMDALFTTDESYFTTLHSETFEE